MQCALLLLLSIAVPHTSATRTLIRNVTARVLGGINFVLIVHVNFLCEAPGCELACNFAT